MPRKGRRKIVGRLENRQRQEREQELRDLENQLHREQVMRQDEELYLGLFDDEEDRDQREVDDAE